jgi:hypothetical protein
MVSPPTISPFDGPLALIASRSLPPAAKSTRVTTSSRLPAMDVAADFLARACRDSRGRALFNRPMPKPERALMEWSEQLPKDTKYAALDKQVICKIMAASLDMNTTSLQFNVGALAHLPTLKQILPPLPKHVVSVTLSFDGADGAVMPRFRKKCFSRVTSLLIEAAEGVMGDLDLAAFQALERLHISGADGVGRVDASACRKLREIDIDGATQMEELRLPPDPHTLKKVLVVGSDRLPPIEGVPQDCVVVQRASLPAAPLASSHAPTSRKEVLAAANRVQKALERLRPCASSGAPVEP